jgi:hypothetical protein
MPPGDHGQGGDSSTSSAAYSSFLFIDGTVEGDDFATFRERFGDEVADRMEQLRDLHGRSRPLTEEERAAVRETMAPVLRDIEASGAILPSIQEEAYEDVGDVSFRVWVWGSDGTGMGLVMPTARLVAERVVRLAEQLQEWEIEELAAVGRSATWPECPDHPNSHPLEPIVDDKNMAVWRCPRAGHVVCEIGTLDRYR